MASGNGNYQKHQYHVEVNVSSPKSTSEEPTARPCLCSPTTHEGSFRCRLHRLPSNNWGRNPLPTAKQPQHAKSVEAR